MSQLLQGKVASAPTEENIKHIRSIIEDNKMCMLTSIDPDTGKLHSRPMYTAFSEVDFMQNRTLYFFTHRSSHKMKETGRFQSRDCNLSFSSSSSKTWLSLTGKGQISLDKTKMQQLWNSALEPWFEHGLQDPDLALIQVQVDSAEYWDSPTGAKGLMNKAKAKISGQPAVHSSGHQIVNLAGLGSGFTSAGTGLSQGIPQQGISSQAYPSQQVGSSSTFSSGIASGPATSSTGTVGHGLSSGSATTGRSHNPLRSEKPFAGGAHPGVVEGVVPGTSTGAAGLGSQGLSSQPLGSQGVASQGLGSQGTSRGFATPAMERGAATAKNQMPLQGQPIQGQPIQGQSIQGQPIQGQAPNWQGSSMDRSMDTR